MKGFSRWNKRPSVFHSTCETKECCNYYNTKYKHANGLCKPCNVKLKRDSEDSLLHDQDERERL
mgnify:FL=1